jgi:hypothetical protein
MVVALCAHGAAYAATDRNVRPVDPPPTPLEVDLAPLAELEPPPDPPAPVPEPDDAPPAPAPRPQSKRVERLAAAPPARAAAGKVGALLTAGKTSDSSDPVALLSDPNGGA